MEDTERKNFDEQWRKAFSDAEADPSEKVWSTIELKLENRKMKRRVFYYQRLAAALLLFVVAMSVIILGDWSGDEARLTNAKQQEEKSTSNLGKTKEANEQLSAANEVTAADENNKESTETNKQKGQPVMTADKNESNPPVAKNLNQKSSDVYGSKLSDKADVSSRVAGTENNMENFITGNESGNSSNPVSSSNTSTEATTFPTRRILMKDLAEPTPILLASILQPELKVVPEGRRELPAMPAEFMASETRNESSEESLWLAVAGNAGSYNSGISPNIIPAASSFDSRGGVQAVAAPPKSEPASTGTAYSIGFNVGKKIAKRWILQSGVTYLTQSLNYTSNLVSYGQGNVVTAFVSEFSSANSALAITQPYTVTNSLEFVSVPLQVGYLIVDRKLGWQMNVGLAPDFFIRSTLRDQSGQSAKLTQGRGEDSPYRSLNWAGLASTELSYKISSHYRISIAPGIRYGFEPTLRSTNVPLSKPIVFDIGFRFRYIFH